VETHAADAAIQPTKVVTRGKFRPPPTPEGYVARRRLDELLGALIERERAVAVCAAAGAGKTTAVASAARSLGLPLAWLTLDPADAAPGHLVLSLEAALARRLPRLAGVAAGALAARLPQPQAARELIEAIGDAPLLIAVDELERLAGAGEAWDVIAAVVESARRRRASC